LGIFYGTDNVIIGEYTCIPGELNSDQKGDVCVNDEEGDDAYCSCVVGPNVCMFCKSLSFDVSKVV